MNIGQVSILSLKYKINFRDADEGDCYAGDGIKILSIHKERAVADAIAQEFNPVVREAEKETTVFPVQKHNAILKERFGFTLHDIDEGYDFQFIVDTHQVC